MARLDCPFCGKKLQAGEDLLRTGGTAKCPACRETFKIPAAEALPLEVERVGIGKNEAELSAVGGAQVRPISPRPAASALGLRTALLVLGGIALCGLVGVIVALAVALSRSREPRPGPEGVRSAFGASESRSRTSRPPPQAERESAAEDVRMPDRSSEMESPKRESIRALESEIQGIKRQKSNLEGEVQRLEQKVRSLEEQKTRLDEQIKSQTSKLELLRDFQQATFVLVAPPSVIAIREEGDGNYLVQRKSDDPDALSAVEKAGVQRLQDRNLTQQVASTPEGSRVQGDPARKIQELWKPQKFIVVERTGGLRFASFYDVERNAQRVALFDSVADDHLIVQGFSEAKERVPRRRCQPGTLRIGSAADVRGQTQNSAFLDFCLFNAVAQCESKGGEKGLVLMLLKVHADLGKFNRVDYITELSNAFGFQGKKSLTLEQLSAYVEDQLTGRLRAMGVRVLEPAEVIAILKERRSWQLTFKQRLQSAGLVPLSARAQKAEDDAEEARTKHIETTKLTAATHVILVDLKPPIEGGLYHATLRLTKPDSNEVLYSEDGEQYVVNTRNFYLPVDADGRLARIVPQGSDTSLEFSSTVYRILGSILPPAGRIRFAGGSADNAYVTLGSRHGVKVGDKLRVMRLTGEGGADFAPDTVVRSSFLSAELSVTEVDDKACRVFKGPTGTEQYWPQDAQILSDDLAIAKFHKRPKVLVQVPTYVQPPQEVIVQLKLNIPARSQRLVGQAIDVSRGFASTLGEALKQCNASVVGNADKPDAGWNNARNAQPVPEDVSHVVSGTITHLSETKFRFRLAVRPANSEEVADQFEITLVARPK